MVLWFPSFRTGHFSPEACCFLLFSWTIQGSELRSCVFLHLTHSLGNLTGIMALYVNTSHKYIASPNLSLSSRLIINQLVCVSLCICTFMYLQVKPRSSLQVALPKSLVPISEGQPHPSRCRKHPWLLSSPQFYIQPFKESQYPGFSPPHCYHLSLIHQHPLNGWFQLPFNWSPSF